MEATNEYFGTLVFKKSTLYIKFLPEFEVTQKEVELIHQKGLEHYQERLYAIIVDFSNNASSTPEARSFGAANKYIQQHIAYGIVAKSLAEKLLVNFFIKFNKPKVSCRLFNCMKSSENWIEIKIRQKLTNQKSIPDT